MIYTFIIGMIVGQIIGITTISLLIASSDFKDSKKK